MSQPWESDFAAGFQAIVTAGPAPAVAVAHILAFQEQARLDVPRFYVSTAISSGGHRWETDPDLRPPAGIPEAIRRNNRTAALIMQQVASTPGALLSGSNSMVPTELGHVAGWTDLDYLSFYFAWTSGLSADGAAWMSRQLSDPAYAEIFEKAANRDLGNDERWPSYRAFTEIAIAKIEQARSTRDNWESDGAEVLVQLVDVEQSLGCRAEALFAEIRGLDVISPSFGDVGLELGQDIEHLRGLGATVGRLRGSSELVAVTLR